MVTYLPTILINIINQLTNYINGDSKYDLIITVNITSMMVLASIYLSVSASLPSTAAMKPVEVWLLFNLAYPFLVIFVNIILQVKSLLMIIILIIIHAFQRKAELEGKEKVKKFCVEENKRKTQLFVFKIFAFTVNPISYVLFCIFYFFIYSNLF